MNYIVSIDQLKRGYIKGNKIKHISPNYFFTHGMEKKDNIKVQQSMLYIFLTRQLNMRDCILMFLYYIFVQRFF